MKSNRFTPGQILGFGHTKRGQEIIFRCPTSNDVKKLWKFINDITKENVFIGRTEPVSLKDERAFVASRISGLKKQHAVFVTAWVGKELAGVCGIDRPESGRSTHVGTFGISIGKKFRNQGVGKQIALITLDAAKQSIPGLRVVRLEVFSSNHPAVTLYKKLGFKPYGQLPNGLFYKNKYFDDVLMYKTI